MSLADYSSDKVKFSVFQFENKDDMDMTCFTGWLQDEKSLEAIKYKYYNGNSEWELFAYKIYTEERLQTRRLKQEEGHSTVIMKFGFQRNSTYFTMTLIIPIIALTLIAPIGLILPG